jgi:capsular polysaccharide biosynthesis protein
MRSPLGRPGWTTWLALAAAAVTFMAALFGIGLRSTSYQAEAQVLIGPTTTSVEGTVNAIDVIGRGNVVDSFAKAYSGSELRTLALRDAGVSAEDRARVTVSAEQIGQSAVISFTAGAADPELAVAAANALAEYEPVINGITNAYRPQVIEVSGGATEAGASTPFLLLLALVLATVVGVAVKVLADRLLNRGRLFGVGSGTPEPPGGLPGGANGDGATERPPAARRGSARRE